MEIDDKNLLAAHCHGEPTAFEQIVRRHGNEVFRFLKRMSGNQQEAEDLFQETFKLMLIEEVPVLTDRR